MKQIIKKLILAFIIIILVKTILVSIIPVPSAFSDSYLFSKMARSFHYSNEISVHGIQKDSLPLYSIFLSIAYFFNNYYLIMKIINVILSSLIIFPAFYLSKEFFNKKKSLLISILISMLPSNFSFSGYIMAENLLYTLFLTSIYFIYKSFNNIKYFILAIIFSTLTILTKMSAIILIPILLIPLFYNIKKAKFLLILVTIITFLIIKYYFPSYFQQATNILKGFSLIKILIIWIIMYLGVVILSTFIIPSILFFYAIKKEKKFSIIALSSIFLTIVVAANHNLNLRPSALKYTTLLPWLTGRPIGRYIDLVLPLIIILGFIGLKYYKKNKQKFKTYLISTFVILILSSQLIFFPLFPINNMSLTWIGISKYIFEFLTLHKTSFDTIYYFPSIFLYLGIITILLTGIYILHKKDLITFKNLIYPLIILFLILSLLNYGINYYNSSTYWNKSQQIQLGRWFNNYDPKINNILFDERDCGELTKTNQTAICLKDHSSTFIGFFMNDNIRIGNIENKDNFNYIISKHKLNLPIIKEQNKIYIYSTS